MWKYFCIHRSDKIDWLWSGGAVPPPAPPNSAYAYILKNLIYGVLIRHFLHSFNTLIVECVCVCGGGGGLQFKHPDCNYKLVLCVPTKLKVSSQLHRSCTERLFWGPVLYPQYLWRPVVSSLLITISRLLIQTQMCSSNTAWPLLRVIKTVRIEPSSLARSMCFDLCNKSKGGLHMNTRIYLFISSSFWHWAL